jgi:hypothetical protein
MDYSDPNSTTNIVLAILLIIGLALVLWFFLHRQNKP